jgi:hypothetical protein
LDHKISIKKFYFHFHVFHVRPTEKNFIIIYFSYTNKKVIKCPLMKYYWENLLWVTNRKLLFAPTVFIISLDTCCHSHIRRTVKMLNKRIPWKCDFRKKSEQIIWNILLLEAVIAPQTRNSRENIKKIYFWAIGASSGDVKYIN